MDRSSLDDKTKRLADYLSNPVVKRSVMVSGHATSVSLEQPFWDELSDMAQKNGKSLNTLISEIDKLSAGNLSSALRLYILNSLTQ